MGSMYMNISYYMDCICSTHSIIYLSNHVLHNLGIPRMCDSLYNACTYGAHSIECTVHGNLLTLTRDADADTE